MPSWTKGSKGSIASFVLVLQLVTAGDPVSQQHDHAGHPYGFSTNLSKSILDDDGREANSGETLHFHASPLCGADSDSAYYRWRLDPESLGALEVIQNKQHGEVAIVRLNHVVEDTQGLLTFEGGDDHHAPQIQSTVLRVLAPDRPVTTEALGQLAVFHPELAVDQEGDLHVVGFTDKPPYSYTNRVLIYSWQQSGRWHEAVTPMNATPQKMALAVDGRGAPHIAYIDNEHALIYGRWNGESWLWQTIPNVGSFEVAVARDGTPHVAYVPHRSEMEPVALDLKFATHEAGGWHTETIDYATDKRLQGVRGFKFQLDSQDKPHLIYTFNHQVTYYSWEPHNTHVKAKSELRYASRPGSRWRIERIREQEKWGDIWELALDAQDKPYFLVEEGPRNYLLQQSTATGWTSQPLPLSETVGRNFYMHETRGLEIDGAGRVHFLVTNLGESWIATSDGDRFSASRYSRKGKIAGCDLHPEANGISLAFMRNPSPAYPLIAPGPNIWKARLIHD